MATTLNGARMLPAFCPSVAPPGERELFSLLAKDPKATSWLVLHSLDIADHVHQTTGEADFVILIPDEGIVVLEVKSHDYIGVNNQGWWFGRADKPEKRGPFRQAADAMHSIRRYLQQRNLAASVPMISAVAFTSVGFKMTSSEWHEWQVLDKQGLYARPISESILNIIRRAREHYVTKGHAWMRNGVDAGSKTIAKIAAALRPRFEMLASPSARRQKLESNLLQCTEEQFRILDDTALNDRLLISGLAGTGKTTLAIEAVRREKSTRPSGLIGFFCFTKLLGKKLEVECSGIGEGVRLGSFHSWMLEFSGIKPTADRLNRPEFWSRDLPEHCLAKLMTLGMPSGILDLLVIDEAQDLFLGAYLDVFDLLLKGGLKRGRWKFFGDFERQDIFAQGAVSIDDFYRNWVDERCGIRRLSENCRNTQEISAALTLHARLDPGYSKVLREDTRNDPDLVFYSGEDEQQQAALLILDRFVTQGFRASDIVLLSPLRDQCLARTLAATSAWKGRLKEYGTDPNAAGFTTIHAFKGMEAPVVIVTDIQKLDSSADLDLLYVGMSRALHRLAVICHDTVRNKIQKHYLS